MDEITLDDKVYVSSKRAAKITGYAKDYVGQLCREGKVEARLVGRNWYILETSIREHRFGIPEKSLKEATHDSVAEIEPNKDWEISSYTPVVSPELLPTLIPQPVTDNTVPQEAIKPELKPLSSSVVREMQSAWQDWFTRTDELKVSKEVLLEEAYSEEPVELLEERYENSSEDNENAEQGFEAGTTSIELEKVIPDSAQSIAELKNEQNIELEDENVPIKRTYSVPVVPQTRSASLSREVNSIRYDSNIAVPQGRIIRERRILVTEKKPNAFLQILLLLIAVVAIGSAFVGSGVIEPYLTKYNINMKAVNYLAGESSVNK